MIISIASSTFLFSTSFLCSTLLLIYLCISAFTRSPSCSFCQALHATRLDVNPSFCKFPIRKRGENMHRMCSVPFHGLMSCLASLIRLLSLRIGTDDNAKLWMSDYSSSRWFLATVFAFTTLYIYMCTYVLQNKPPHIFKLVLPSK